MSRFRCASGGHRHLAWESQPLVGPVPRRRNRPFPALAMAAVFVFGVVLGLIL
ncbi:MAG: hypothetical protein AB7E60_01740 [Sphingobium sp.]